LELDETSQAPIARPPDQSGFEHRATQRSKVFPNQPIALRSGKFRKAKLQINGRNAPVTAAETIGKLAEQAAEAQLRAERQHIDEAYQRQRNPKRPVPWASETIQGDVRPALRFMAARGVF
jgi:hypothetical protein